MNLFYKIQLATIISISIVLILMNADQAFAFCDAHSEPCFERIKTFDKIDDHFVRNYFFDYADDVFGSYDWPNKSDDVANNFDGFPAIYCFEIIVNDEPHFLMINWIDHNSISNIVDMYVPELCEQSINPIDSENRPDSLYVNKPMKTPTPKPNVLISPIPNLHPDDLQSCLLGDFDGKNYRWCDNYIEEVKSQPPLKQFQSGILINEIQCKEALIRMAKHDGTPACVTQSTAPKLSDRGWSRVLDLELWEKNHLLIPPTNYEIQNDDGNYGSQYMISGASIENILYDENHNSLVISLNSHEKGILQIVMPIGLLHPVTHPPFSYVVLANSIEIGYEELSPIMLRIMFDSGTERIEIMGFDN